MGCVNSQPEFPNDIHPNLFTVTTISRPNNNGAFNDSSPSRDVAATGQLEVATTEIVLHRRGHDPVHWPLQYIRRYGFENHLFSFESGRRCESGPGIFTFRCRRARELFLLVQSNVQDARSPPPAAIANRLRSGSATSQNRQFPSPGPPPPLRATAADSANGRLSLNDYLASDRASDRRLSNGVAAAAHHHQHSASPSPRSGSAIISDGSGLVDELDGGQVFEEITPLRSSNLIAETKMPRLRNEEKRQRLSSARSHTSSAASDRSLTTSLTQYQIQQQSSRPISFEFILSSTSSPRDDGGSSNALAPSSPPQQIITTCTSNAASPPASPPSFAYYVNIDPPSTSTDLRPKKIDSQRHLSADRYPNGEWRPPARSHSLGSPQRESAEQCLVDLCSADGAYVNIARTRDASPSPSASPTPSAAAAALRTVETRGAYRRKSAIASPPVDENTALDYVTLDIRGGEGSSANGPLRSPRRQYSHTGNTNETTTTTSFCSSSVGGKQLLFFANGSTSISEFGPPTGNSNRNEETRGTSNYARIDCTRTKALRETAAAAHMQRQSTSCSASSSSEATLGGDQATAVCGGRRTRHDSSRK